MLELSWRRTILTWLLSLLVFASVASRVTAQGEAEPAEYRTTIREALAEYHRKNFPEARALFSEAHRLMPNARTLRGLGMTAFELRSYSESIRFLEEALASSVKPLEGALRSETERLLRRAERFVGRLQLLLTPVETTVTVDGTTVERREGQPLILAIGTHSLEFAAEGHETETRTIQIRGKENETWTVALTPLPPPPPVVATPREVAEQAAPEPAPQPAPREEEHAARPLRKNPWLWTGVGAVVVAAIVTGVAIAVSDPEVGAVRTGDNTPPRGILMGLEASQ